MIALRNPNFSALPPPGRDELAAWLRLALTNGVGPASALTLLRAFGSPKEVLAASHTGVAQVVGAALATRLVRPDPEIDEAVAASLAWADAPDCHLITLADADYPRALLDIPDPPALLFVRGQKDTLNMPAMAIVGSRQASLAGQQNATAFSQHLAGRGLCIVSGLAKGIDAAAHQGALTVQGKTIGVLGTGIDRIYPAGNRALAKQLVTTGALISEFPLGTGPFKANFPRRNRLIAGLSAGVLVVEAARRSGSLITARLAGEFGREVFAIPGSIHSMLSRGCHQLIRDGARLVESADDILSELRTDLFKAAPGTTGTMSSKATVNTSSSGTLESPPEVAKNLLEIIGWEPVSYDLLTKSLSLHAGDLDEYLLKLELDGWLERLPDGRLRRLA